MEEKAIIDILNSRNTIGLNSKKDRLERAKILMDREFSLYHIEELTFEEESPRKEALENVLSSLRIDGITFIYLLQGDRDGVHFYFGIAKDKSYNKELVLDVDDIGRSILQSSIVGNFRGSKVKEVSLRDSDIREKINNMRKFAKIVGVPNVNEDSEDFQGVDRLVDVMSGDDFALLILADPLNLEEVETIENRLYGIHNKLSPLAKKNIQSSDNRVKTTSETEGINKTETNSTNEGTSTTATEGTNDSTANASNKGVTKSKNTSSNSSSSSTQEQGTEGTTRTISEGTSKSEAVAKSESSSKSFAEAKSFNKSINITETKNESISMEYGNKSVQEWIKYIDETLLKRIDYGRSKGLFYTNIYLLANTTGTLIKLGNTIMSLFSGIEGNKVPLQLFLLDENSDEIESIKNFQLPNGILNISENEADARLLLSQSINKSNSISKFGNWLSTNELSVIAGLPQKEVVGLSLKEEIEFGLNPRQQVIVEDKKLHLGNLVRSGNILNIEVDIDKDNLDKHTFITGVTGSGKTTTCHRILNSAKMPFMVIEPAKTEYRILTKLREDVLIFTLGNDNVAPFRLNPFEFFPHENITSRVDMIKASIEAAFDMEAAIPQIIEAALYKCYEEYGWNIGTNKNNKFEDPFADGIYSFPTLSDLIRMTEVVVNEQGFDDRLKNDYIGSIKARLQGLLVGSKGLMLNTPRSVDFKELTRKNVILELEEIRNGNEKSLIMGFVMTNLNEAIRANYEEDKKQGKQFKHITLIEEAHRLLTKFNPGESPTKKQGVEVFADMLAEVRKYGEALIIVDQIPNKLTPEVLKNTNTKIVHKLFAKDDKEAIGNTMALEDEQKDFLSYLEPGRAIVSTQGMNKPVQIQIKQLENISTTESDIVEKEEIRKNSLMYYKKNYKKGIIQGLELFEKEPSLEEIEDYITFFRSTDSFNLSNEWTAIFITKEKDKGFELKHYTEKYPMKYLVSFLFTRFYSFPSFSNELEKIKNLTSFLEEVKNGRYKIEFKEYKILQRECIK